MRLQYELHSLGFNICSLIIAYLMDRSLDCKLWISRQVLLIISVSHLHLLKVKAF